MAKPFSKGDVVRFKLGGDKLSDTTVTLHDVWESDGPRNCSYLSGGVEQAWHTDLLQHDGDTSPVVMPQIEEWFICVGNRFGWGRAKTEAAAIANMRRASSGDKVTWYAVHRCNQFVGVGDMGGLSWPQSLPEPELVKEVDQKKKRA